jgi:hypothetical protein
MPHAVSSFKDTSKESHKHRVEEHRHHLTGSLETLGAFRLHVNFEENPETLTLADHAHGVDSSGSVLWERA